MGFDYFKVVYLGARGLEFVALCAVIGMVANFVRETNEAQHQAPPVIMAILVSSIISFFWMVISVTQYDDTHIPYFVTGAVDSGFLIIFAVIAIILGQPMSMALSNCYSLPTNANGTYSSYPVVGANSSFINGTMNGTSGAYLQLQNISPQTACLELNAVWGLTIALAICFFLSGTFAALLWVGKRRQNGQGGGGEAADVEEKTMPASDAGSSWTNSPHIGAGSVASSHRGSFDHNQ